MASTKIYLDKRYPTKDYQYYVKLRITHARKSEYYSTGIKLTEKQFENAYDPKRRTQTKSKELYLKLISFENKAKECIDKIPYFTFEQFDKLYRQNRGATDSIESLFKEYAGQLKEEGRIGYSTNYTTAFNSLNSFRKNLKFVDITPSFLRSYHEYMLRSDKSPTTIGIYLRPLRKILNLAIDKGRIDSTLYPFGRGKYVIPTGKNIKKALSRDEIDRLKNYEPISDKEAFAKDIWLFSYYCNGINICDILTLKWGNIDGDNVRYIRTKTKRTNSHQVVITAPLLDAMKTIVEKYGADKYERDGYIFPFISKYMDDTEKRNKIQLITRTVNKYLKRMGTKLDIQAKLTTYTARHSHATVLRNNNFPIDAIRDNLGHSSINTTKNYLAGFDDDFKKEMANSL